MHKSVKSSGLVAPVGPFHPPTQTRPTGQQVEAPRFAGDLARGPWPFRQGADSAGALQASGKVSSTYHHSVAVLRIVAHVLGKHVKNWKTKVLAYKINKPLQKSLLGAQVSIVEFPAGGMSPRTQEAMHGIQQSQEASCPKQLSCAAWPQRRGLWHKAQQRFQLGSQASSTVRLLCKQSWLSC